MKAYNKPFLIICAFLNGIITIIKQVLVYNRAIDIISKSKTIIHPSLDIGYIALHSPLTLYDATEVYPLMQMLNIDKEEIIRYVCMYGGNVENIKRWIRKEVDEYGY